MDDLAHALVGTLVARAHPSRNRGLVWACVFGSLIPDIDIVLTLWGRQFYVTEHRGFTHSLLGLIPMSLLAAVMAYWLFRKKKDRATFLFLWAMAFTGVVSHILLDLCTSWGTMLLWPNRTRFAWDQLFIIDPWYWGLLAIPVLLSFLWNEKRAAICTAGLIVGLCYHGLAWFNHREALSIAENDRPTYWKAAFPQPFSPFRWSVFDRGDRLLKNARVDFLKSPKPLEWQQWPDAPVTPELKLVMDSERGKTFLWFSRVPMWEEEKLPDGSYKVTGWDARFNNNFTKQRVSRGFGGTYIVKDGKVTGGGL